MPKFEVIISTVALLIVVGALIWAFGDKLPALRSRTSKQTETIETQAGSDQLVKKQAASLEQIAQEFVQHYSKAVTTNDQEAATAAKNLLSEHGRNVVETDSDAVTGLQRLTTSISAPQRLEIIENRKQSDSFAEVTAKWIYSDKALERYFYFTLENKEWKIDSIQEIKQ